LADLIILILLEIFSENCIVETQKCGVICDIKITDLL